MSRRPVVTITRLLVCAICGRGFHDQRTLVMHHNATHPDTYDDEEKEKTP